MLDGNMISVIFSSRISPPFRLKTKTLVFHLELVSTSYILSPPSYSSLGSDHHDNSRTGGKSLIWASSSCCWLSGGDQDSKEELEAVLEQCQRALQLFQESKVDGELAEEDVEREGK